MGEDEEDFILLDIPRKVQKLTSRQTDLSVFHDNQDLLSVIMSRIHVQAANKRKETNKPPAKQERSYYNMMDDRSRSVPPKTNIAPSLATKETKKEDAKIVPTPTPKCEEKISEQGNTEKTGSLDNK